jgi:hypothetical protein
VNGSQRWCLNCAAEWPTAALFLAEVNGLEDRKAAPPTHQQLQNRFLNILAQLDDQDVRLSQINTWLDTLEAQLELAETTGDPVELMLPIPLMPVSAHA